MSYFNEIINLLSDVDSLWILVELLFVTSCISTIIFFLNRNEYISFLSAAPIFYILSNLLFFKSHILLIILAMAVQAVIININFVQKIRNRNTSVAREKNDILEKKIQE
ncbi:hypothetical protein [Ureibacillus sinduriensis]|uniref:Uncharacterized protein n=1 Tax=Ureibacillus sinduriensis BLB-1 = JCM 15800 TaxID=1384057 RepID=A0A0A3HZD6_9BACL|nr:hypothetical protein [Ureibacillus sinduriensis]KGR77946.1 hypothetical protein CD33_01855 [Ureibacillus sinduriensis BLB-1 = JCM 15800]